VISGSVPAGRRLAALSLWAPPSSWQPAAPPSSRSALVLARHPPAPLFVVGVGAGLLGTLALARYDAAAAVGFLLLGVVFVEPAPTDIILAVVIAVAFVTGRFAFDRVPRAAVILVVAYLMINFLASVEVVDAGRAASFLSTTIYLCILAAWVASYVDSSRRARLIVRTYLAAALASALLVLAALLLPIPGRESSPRARAGWRSSRMRMSSARSSCLQR
jgi:hypothetical protein